MSSRLAWRDLLHNRQRLVVSVVGITFAVFLIFIEMGFLNAVYDSQTDLVRILNADLVMVNRFKESLLTTQPFPRRRLIQALAVEGVQAAYPVYIEEFKSIWKDLGSGHAHAILAVAFDPEDPAFLLPEIARKLPELRLPDRAIADAQARRFYGDLVEGREAELAGRKIRLVGTFDLGPDFRTDGMLIMTRGNFLQYFSNSRLRPNRSEEVEIGLLKVRPGADPGEVRDRLSTLLPRDVDVLTKDQYSAEIENYWRTYQPIGTVFGLGMTLGFVIGIAVCYQLLFTDIVDHYRQYATLKAMGYFDSFLTKVVLQKAWILAAAGFAVSLVLALGGYVLLEQLTSLRLRLTPLRALPVLGAALFMCSLGAILALRKVKHADPADLF